MDCYDKDRNARTFIGDYPVIAHPPCRGWSRSMSKLSKPDPGEMDLAYFCIERILRNGGVLEHPFLSNFVTLFLEDVRFQVIRLDQDWFGNEFRKRTWLLMPRGYEVQEMPFRLVTYGGSKKQWANINPKRRMETPIEFAHWLIDLVRLNNA